MAKELMVGIQDSVEDLAASFKKMAILHAEEASVEITIPVDEPKPSAEPIAIQTKQTRRKKIQMDGNQLSLFDLVA